MWQIVTAKAETGCEVGISKQQKKGKILITRVSPVQLNQTNWFLSHHLQRWRRCPRRKDKNFISQQRNLINCKSCFIKVWRTERKLKLVTTDNQTKKNNGIKMKERDERGSTLTMSVNFLNGNQQRQQRFNFRWYLLRFLLTFLTHTQQSSPSLLSPTSGSRP